APELPLCRLPLRCCHIAERIRPWRASRKPLWCQCRIAIHVTIIRVGHSGAEAALHERSAAEPRVQREIEAVEHLTLLAEGGGLLNEIVHGPSKDGRRLDVIEPANLVATSAWQSRIARQRDAVRIVVRRRVR